MSPDLGKRYSLTLYNNILTDIAERCERAGALRVDSKAERHNLKNQFEKKKDEIRQARAQAQRRAEAKRRKEELKEQQAAAKKKKQR